MGSCGAASVAADFAPLEPRSAIGQAAPPRTFCDIYGHKPTAPGFGHPSYAWNPIYA